MKKKLLLVVMLVLLAALSSVIYASSRDPYVYGPYVCTQSCALGTPVPDAPTLAYLQSWYNYYGQYGVPDRVPFVPLALPRDKFIVCNEYACVTYTRTDSGLFAGDAAVPRTTSGPPSGGGGAGSGTGGTYYGVVGYQPIYRTAQSCTPGGCITQQVLVGYETIYGWLPKPGVPTVKER